MVFKATKSRIVGALVGLSLALVAVPTTSGTASAGDGRSVSAEGELRALYVHGLGRQPDAGGWNMYLSMIKGDCQWNLNRATWDILSSAEAANRWRTPENLVGALYAAALDRAPDAGGFATYVQMAKQRGFGLAITNVLASSEYKGRLTRVCATLPASVPARMMMPRDSISLAGALFDASKYLGAACFISFVSQLAKVPGPQVTAVLVKDAIRATDAVAAVQGWASVTEQCLAIYRVFQAMDYAYARATEDYPVFWRVDTIVKHDIWPPDECTTYIRLGTDPSHWTTWTPGYSCGTGISVLPW